MIGGQGMVEQNVHSEASSQGIQGKRSFCYHLLVPQDKEKKVNVKSLSNTTSKSTRMKVQRDYERKMKENKMKNRNKMCPNKILLFLEFKSQRTLIHEWFGEGNSS